MAVIEWRGAGLFFGTRILQSAYYMYRLFALKLRTKHTIHTSSHAQKHVNNEKIKYIYLPDIPGSFCFLRQNRRGLDDIC